MSKPTAKPRKIPKPDPRRARAGEELQRHLGHSFQNPRLFEQALTHRSYSAQNNERLPRGADRNTHTKLGRGGLTDIEWIMQVLEFVGMHHREQLHGPLDICKSTAPRGALRRRRAHHRLL